MDGFQRPFATGSKPGPDAVDHYLEEKGFYRKHVARDASSLFRVVSEQVFDIQNYHEKVRQDCTRYMEGHKRDFSNDVDKNFFNYVSQMRRPRTHGTLLELRVLARMYKRNVILFEPTQSLQTTSHVYIKDDAYDNEEPLRVFFSQKDKHFDVIYTMEYARRLASCQSIVYDILYSQVFKLPDVQYAVERMLHDQDEQVTLPLADDPLKYQTASGEIIPFDSHSQTDCVLKDPKTCHFHNQVDFEEIVNERKDAITVINQKNEPGRMKVFKPIDGFLYDQNKSCVRQLLAERITPFPYKVAKALDPCIYRNTEFELWSENRKEQRMKWLNSADFSPKQYSDDKWSTYDCDRCYRGGPNGTRKNCDGKFERPIVDEMTYMSLDDDLKKKYIVLKSQSEPFKLQSLTNMDNFLPSRDSLELTVMPINTNYSGGTYKKRGGGRPNTYHNRGHHHFNANQHGSSSHQASSSHLTHASDIERESFYQEQPEPQQYYQQHSSSISQETPNYDQAAAPLYQQIPQHWNNQQLVPFVAQQPFQYASLNYQQVMPYGNFTIPPPQSSLVQVAPQNLGFGSGDGVDVMNIIRESELSSTTINWAPKESTDHTGADLPSNASTLQFYYNLGVRYFLASGVQQRLESTVQQLENLEINDSKSSGGNASEKSNDQKLLKVQMDPPPAPANTPVSTKSVAGNYGPPGYRYAHNNSYNNSRRPFGGRDTHRDGGNYRGSWNSQPRKEIKFNSNVRNVYKGDTKNNGSGSQSTSSQAVQTQIFHGSGESGNNVLSSQEKSPPNSNAKAIAKQYSPGSFAPQESQPAAQAQPMLSFEQTQQQFPQSYPGAQTFIQPQQQVGMVYQMAEDGSSYMVQPLQQPMQYSHPYPYPVYYPVQNYAQGMDGSAMSSNDSGVDSNMYQGYQQPQVQYYPAPPYQVSPVPMYLASSPMPQTPQIAPMFPSSQPVPIQLQVTHSPQAPVAVSQQTSSEKLTPKTSEEATAQTTAT